MYNRNKQNEQIYGRTDMVMLDGHNKIYGSLGIAEPYVLQSQEGTSIVARGIKEGRFDDVVTDFRMFGRSEQFTTTGAQLIPFELDAEITSKDGVSKCVPKKDGFHIELNGEVGAGSDSDIYFLGGFNSTTESSYVEYENLPAGTYYAKISNNRYSLIVAAWRGRNVTLVSTTTGGTFTVQEDDKLRIFIRPSITAVDGTIQAIISKQNDSVMYEPYTVGKPSPSTDYQQEVTSTGDDGSVGVDVTGANLWNGGEFEISVGGSITGYSEAPEALVNATKALPNGKYSVSYTTDGSGTAGQRYGYIRFMEGDTAILPESKSFEMTDDLRSRMTKVVLYGYLGQTQTVKEFMLNAGSTHLPYEPYKQPQSLTVQTPNGLPGIPVTSGGNYTDENGQQRISDEVDYRREKYVKRVNKEYLTGTPNFVETPDEPGRYLWNRAFKTYYKTAISVGISNFAKWTAWGLPHIAKGDVFCLQYTHLYYSPIDDDMTAEEVNAKFAEMIASDNPPYIIGQLATPIETDLTPEQMEQFSALRSYYPTTVVTNDEDVWMKMSYKALEMGV